MSDSELKCPKCGSTTLILISNGDDFKVYSCLTAPCEDTVSINGEWF